MKPQITPHPNPLPQGERGFSAISSIWLAWMMPLIFPRPRLCWFKRKSSPQQSPRPRWERIKVRVG
jgi:hypothetical protein